MAFSTLRGRPPRARLDDNDHGTPELQLKRAFNLTVESVDMCLERKLITPDQHWCSLHLRWLYTLRYGAPVITARYDDTQFQSSPTEANSEWRILREQEYGKAVQMLHAAKRYEPVMRLCVFNERPAFLNTQFMQRAWADPSLAELITPYPRHTPARARNPRQRMAPTQARQVNCSIFTMVLVKCGHKNGENFKNYFAPLVIFCYCCNQLGIQRKPSGSVAGHRPMTC